MELEDIRRKINAIDYQIIDLISRRLSFVQQICLYKKQHNLTIFQLEREQQMYSHYWRAAIEKRINPELIRKIFDLLVKEMIRLQEEMQNE